MQAASACDAQAPLAFAHRRTDAGALCATPCASQQAIVARPITLAGANAPAAGTYRIDVGIPGSGRTGVPTKTYFECPAGTHRLLKRSACRDTALDNR
ncbi:hypothetical protein BLAT2472_50040 [Burkholderia latens]